MDFWRRSALLLVAASPCLAHCAPDFDALSAGGESVARGGEASLGGAHDEGGSSASTGGKQPTSGSATAGGTGGASTSGASGTGGSTAGTGGSTAGDGGTNASTGGSAAGTGGSTAGMGGSTAGTGGSTAGTGGSTAGTGGSAAGTGGSAAGTGGSAAGTGGQQGCVTPHAGQLGYEDFDTGLAGESFPDTHASCTMQTLHAATCGEQLDSSAGKTCPGALHFSIAFKAYASGAENDEIAFGDLDFSFADWSQAKALHAMVKVSPAGAPINGVQLFLQSGTDFFYQSIFDAVDFKTGDWHEMVFSLASSGLDLTKIRRLGVHIVLNRAGTPGIPATPPAIDVLLDDVWLEPK